MVSSGYAIAILKVLSICLSQYIVDRPTSFPYEPLKGLSSIVEKIREILTLLSSNFVVL